MAYKRMASRRRRGTRATTQKIRTVVNRMAEKKYKFIPTALVATQATWQFTSIAGQLSQGTTASSRIGDKVILQSLEFAFIMKPEIGMAVEGAMCRIVIYHNKEAVGSLPASAALFTGDNIEAQLTFPNRPRFSLLRDQTHSMIVTSTDPASGNVISVGPTKKITMKVFPKKKICFNANNGTVADLLKDDYGVGIICNAVSSCSVSYTCTMVFTDA